MEKKLAVDMDYETVDPWVTFLHKNDSAGAASYLNTVTPNMIPSWFPEEELWSSTDFLYLVFD